MRGGTLRHPFEKFIRIELVSIGAAVLLGIIGLTLGFLFLISVSLLLLSISLCCEALVDWQTNNTLHAGKQLLRATMAFLFAIYLLII